MIRVAQKSLRRISYEKCYLDFVQCVKKTLFSRIFENILTKSVNFIVESFVMNSVPGNANAITGIDSWCDQTSWHLIRLKVSIGVPTNVRFGWWLFHSHALGAAQLALVGLVVGVMTLGDAVEAQLVAAADFFV